MQNATNAIDATTGGFWVDYNTMIKEGFAAGMRAFYVLLGGGVPSFEDTRLVTQAADLLAFPEQFPDCPKVKRTKYEFIQYVVKKAMRARRAAGVAVPGE
jgi:hypothetical protein